MFSRRGRSVRVMIPQRCLPAWFAGFLILAASPLRAQTFEPTLSVSAGIQTSYQHIDTKGTTPLDRFSLDHARIYINGNITKEIGLMFNTEYDSFTNKIGILDAAGQFSISPKLNVWFGRFLPPSDHATFMAHSIPTSGRYIPMASRMVIPSCFKVATMAPRIGATSKRV